MPAQLCPHYFPDGYVSGVVTCRGCGALIARDSDLSTAAVDPFTALADPATALAATQDPSTDEAAGDPSADASLF